MYQMLEQGSKDPPQKIISAHQPCYLPWLGYFNKIYNSDVFVILDDVQFEKGSYTNRVQIKGQNGAQWLTIPIKQKMGQRIRYVEIAEPGWYNKHRKIINQEYKKPANWTSPCTLLSTACKWSIEWVLDKLDMRLDNVHIQSHWVDIETHRQELIIDLCKSWQCDTFLFGAKGHDYVNVDYFKDNGITPIFQDFKCIPYPQQWGGDFIPGLSVIDALFNVGPERTLELIKGGFNV